MTDLDGEIFQHLEYFPFGETWVEEHSNTQRTPYLFTAKELDEETGLYYFGARYYDPRTSVWQSPDPALGEYIPTATAARTGKANLPGHGGVYMPVNLNLFGYAHQRPIVANDPDGELVWFVVAGVLIVADVGLTAYDQYTMQQDYEAGRISGTEYALRSTGNAALLVVPGDAVAKLGLRAVRGVFATTARHTGVVWGKGILRQGMPWETFLEAGKYVGKQLPPNFKTFDFFDRSTGLAVSAKTMDTTTRSMTRRPNQAYTRLRGYIDKAKEFDTYSLSGTTVTSDMITTRRIELAVPAGSSRAALSAINRAVEYGRQEGVEVVVTIIAD